MFQAASGLLASIPDHMKARFDSIEFVTCDRCGNEKATRNKITQKFMCAACESVQLADDAWSLYQKARRERPKKFFDERSLINPKLQGATFANYHPTNPELAEAKRKLMLYADGFDPNQPKNHVLVGNFGTGKSHVARAVTVEVVEKGFTCLYINIPKLLTTIRSTWDKKSKLTEFELLEYLEWVDLLVLDELGMESSGEDDIEKWSVRKIFQIIDARQGKHTMYTTNYNAKELTERIGGRNLSRVLDETEVIRMYGDDYRMRNFR